MDENCLLYIYIYIILFIMLNMCIVIVFKAYIIPNIIIIYVAIETAVLCDRWASFTSYFTWTLT
jgi:hypothetical protein